tara:strand:+ start:2812 stop:3915 length:1104 start_codon:yes stop_codon:yes gene_type:complete
MGNYYIGLMSGTSADGIDAVVVELDDKHCQLLATHHNAFPHQLHHNIVRFNTAGNNELNTAGELDVKLGHLFAEAALAVLAKTNLSAKDIKAIGSHGQNIRHQPTGDITFTHQIGDPNVIAANTGITTVADFRRKDLALGGQGAPLAPAFHQFMFQSNEVDRLIVNIGGIANLTYLPQDHHQAIIGFDTGPGNALMDSCIQAYKDSPYDENGNWAAQGKVNEKLLQHLLTHPFYSQTGPKSTGREVFNSALVESVTQLFNDEPVNLQATFAELTAITIANAAKHTAPKAEIFLCGGGVENTYLVSRLKHHCPSQAIMSVAELGISPHWLEAMAFAWLAKQRLEKKPGNIPSVTGASRRAILGGVYPP